MSVSGGRSRGLTSTRLYSLLLLIAWGSGCSGGKDLDYVAWDAMLKGDHVGAAKTLLLRAQQTEEEQESASSPSRLMVLRAQAADSYCRAASEFLRAGGKDNVRNASNFAAKGIAAMKHASDPTNRVVTKIVFMCKLTLAQTRWIENTWVMPTGDTEGMRILAKDYADLPADSAVFVFRHTWGHGGHGDYDNLGTRMVTVLRNHAPELADVVEKHYRSSSLQQSAHEAEDARVESIKREQAALEAEAKRERTARENQARAEYERQHPEIARAKQAQAVAEKQYATCKSSCSSQSLGCIAACFGNLEDTMCSGRCQVALNTCENGCEEQRDALIVQAGGTPLGTSSSGSAALLQGLVAMGDGLAAAKGLPSPATSGFATSATPSMQTSVASFAQALSALAGSTVVVPSSKRSSSSTANAEGTPSVSVGSTCDVSAEDREIEAMEKRLPSEVKGMGKKKRECYAAKQYVKIAHFQIRAATRCNLDLTEPKEYLHDAEVQEREFCRDLSMK